MTISEDQAKAIYCFGIFLIMAGIIINFISRHVIQRMKLVEKWLHVRAVVVEIRCEDCIGGKSGEYFYWPVYEYKVKGIRYTGASETKSTGNHYEKGDLIDVKVNPDNVEESYYGGVGNSAFGPGMMAVSVCIIVMSVAIILFQCFRYFK